MAWQTAERAGDGLRLKYAGDGTDFSPEQLMAMVLSKAKRTIETECVDFDACITIPVWWGEYERQRLLDATRIAKMSCIRFIPDITGAALKYGLFRKRDLTEEPRLVAIVDVGHSKGTVALASFKKEELKMCYVSWDKNIGGRNFDWALA